MKHGEPLANYDPSSEQTAAMSARIVNFSLETHPDFSLLTPHGRRLQKRLRHWSWLLQEDGPYLPVEVPGPASWEDGSLAGACMKPSCSCFARTTTTQTRVSPHRLLSRPASSTSRPSSGSFQRHGTWQSRTLPTSCTCSFRRREEGHHIGRRRASLRLRTSVTGLAKFDIQLWVSWFVVVPKLPFSALARICSRRRPPSPGSPNPKRDKKGFFITWADGTSVCFRWSKSSDEEGCRSRCPEGRASVCAICLQPHQTRSHTRSA